jgi:hypothetical protein
MLRFIKASKKLKGLKLIKHVKEKIKDKMEKLSMKIIKIKKKMDR